MIDQKSTGHYHMSYQTHMIVLSYVCVLSGQVDASFVIWLAPIYMSGIYLVYLEAE